MCSTSSSAPLVIIGSGLAGYSLAREWRKLEPDHELIIISADSGRNYSKPMLSTGFAKNKSDEDLSIAHAGKMAEQLKASIFTHETVESIDTTEQTIQLRDRSIAYSKLVLATGSETIQLPIHNTAPEKTFSVNDLDQYAAFREQVLDSKRIVIIGGGLIGCEYANDLCHTDIEITLVELQGQLLSGLVPAEVSAELENTFTQNGIRLQLGASAESIQSTEDGVSVKLSNGSELHTDLVLSAVGVRSRVDLAKTAGLSVDKGITVDQFLATSHENIFALGDCASVNGHNLFYVMPLMQCARALAKTLSGNKTAVSYPAMPIAIKTTLLPIVTNPPASSDCNWNIAKTDDGIRAVAYQGEQLTGFCLAGLSAVKEKATLSKQLPIVLD